MKLVFYLAVSIMTNVSLGLADEMSAKSQETTAKPVGTFPKLTAYNLEKQTLSLPEDFAGDRNLLLIAFQREQQKEVDTWLHEMKRFELLPSFRYYELPTIDKLNPISRWFIDTGMRHGIPDRDARARTITLYIDKLSFRKALNLADEKRIYTLLVDRSGRVLWRAEGVFDEGKASSLQRVLGLENP